MFSTGIIVYRGSSHRRKSAAWHKFDNGLAISLAYPSGEEEVILLVHIPDPDLDLFIRPGSRDKKGTGSRVQIPDPQHCSAHQNKIVLLDKLQKIGEELIFRKV